MKKMKKSVALLALALGITTAGIIATNNTATQTANGGLKGTYDFTAFAEGSEVYTAYDLIGLVSTDGNYLLLLTGIDDVTAYKEIGYKISVNGGAVTTEKMTTYYTSLKTGETEVGQTTIFGEGVQGMIVYEIAYDSANEYSVTPYLTKNDGTEISGTEKTAEAEVGTPIMDACTVIVSATNVNISQINAGKIKYMDQTTTLGTDGGTPVFVTTTDKNNATVEGVYFSKEEVTETKHSEFRFSFDAKDVTKVTFDYKTTNTNTTKDTTDDVTLIQVKQSDGTYVGILHSGLTADGEWHTAEITYAGEITDLIIKMYQFQGEIVVANVNYTIADTYDETAVQTTKETYDLQKYVDGGEIKTKAGKVDLAVTGIPEDYSLTAIKYGTTDVMTEGKLDLAKMPTTAYGEQTVTATYTNGNYTHDVTVPVFVVTKSIANENDLHEIKKIANAAQGGGYFKFTADVAITQQWWISGSGKDTECYQYTIGVSDDKDWGRDQKFKGVIDGNGYAIKDFRLMCNDHPSAFIKNIAGGTVKNLSFMNLNVGGNASLFAYGYGTFENVYVQVNRLVSNSNGAGTWNWGVEGIFSGAGEMDKGSVFKNVTVDFTAPSAQADIATVLAGANRALIGGIGEGVTVEGYVVLGIPAEYTGRVFRHKVSGAWQNFAPDGVTVVTTDGKVNGQDVAQKTVDLNASVVDGAIQYNATTTVDFSDVATGNVTGVYCNTKSVTSAVNGKTATIDLAKLGMAYGEKVLTVITENETVIVNLVVVTKSVSTEDDFYQIAPLVDAMQGGGYYQFTNNIKLTSAFLTSTANAKSIAKNYAFTGTIDGNGYALDNLQMCDSDWAGNSFIQKMAGGTIKNIAFTNIQVGSASYIINEGYGTLENVYLQYSKFYCGTGFTTPSLNGNNTYSYKDNRTGCTFNKNATAASCLKNVVYDYTQVFATLNALPENKSDGVNLNQNAALMGCVKAESTIENVAVVGISTNYVTHVLITGGAVHNASAQGVYVQCGDEAKTTNGVANNLANMNANYFNYAEGVISWKTK